MPGCFLPRPPLDRSPVTLAAFTQYYRRAVLHSAGQTLAYPLAVPKWQFLCWLCNTQEIVLHGSGNPGIREFEPRQANDIVAFGNRQAVYAASDERGPAPAWASSAPARPPVNGIHMAVSRSSMIHASLERSTGSRYRAYSTPRKRP